MQNTDPFTVVEQFERAVALYAGSKYAVAVDSCSNALFLCLKYINKPELTITIPKKTYISVPCSVIHAGYKVRLEELVWTGLYQLKPLPVYDGATRFTKNMYFGGLHCLSFHAKKHLKIGRGGMILTDDENAVKWLKLARFNGRDQTPYNNCNFNMIGWNFYMTNIDAARGLWLLDSMPDYNDDICNEYPDLSKYNIENARSGDKLIKYD
jgi:dTDP-4-amino-4,6-dideoxygalactose transaminase